MRKTHHKIAFAEIPRDYPALVAMHPPRPIHDSVDYANTMEIVMAMAGHDGSGVTTRASVLPPAPSSTQAYVCGPGALQVPASSSSRL